MGRFNDYFYVINNWRADFFEQISLKLPTDEDMAISEMVIEELKDIIKKFNFDEDVYTKSGITMGSEDFKSSNMDIIKPYVIEALNSLTNIGCGQFNKDILEILNKITYKTFDANASAVIYRSFKITDNSFSSNPQFLAVSQPFSNLTKFSLCHEFAHLLKERFNNELYLFFTKLEVVTKALEFIPAFKNGNVSDLEDVVKDHILSLYYTSAEDYLLYKDELTSDASTDFEKRALKFALNHANCYLNSFYYALILFRLYLDEPEYIIELINMVLGGQITSEDMFDYLDKKKFDNYASDGLAEIKKYLK